MTPARAFALGAATGAALITCAATAIAAVLASAEADDARTEADLTEATLTADAYAATYRRMVDQGLLP